MMVNKNNRKNHSLPNDVFFKEVQHFLRNGREVTIYVQGGSMRPFLENGDKVLLTPPFNHGKIGRGSIVLARTSIGIVLHRVVRIRKQGFILAGDANAYQVEQTTREDVIAIVKAVWRKEQRIDIDSFRIRAIAWLWYLVRPLRGGLLRVYYKLKYKKNKEE